MKQGRLNLKRFDITISAKFGSEFQYSSAFNALKSMLRAWKIFYKTTHKKNLISDAIIKVDYIEEVRES